MSILSSIGGFFKKLGSLMKRGFLAASENGLTDPIVDQALQLAIEASQKFSDNETRRSWVIAALTKIKVPESIARIALELAVQLIKKGERKIEELKEY